MLGLLVTLILWLLIIGIIYAIADYVITHLVPEPPAHIVRVVVVVLVGLAIIFLLLDLVGGISGVNLPRLDIK